MNNLIGDKGINFNIGLETTDILLLAGGIFAALVLAGIITVIVQHSLRKKSD